MKNYSFTRSMTDKLSIKGELSSDGRTITFENADKESETVAIAKCLEPFFGENVEFAIAVKTNQDLGENVGGD